MTPEQRAARLAQDWSASKGSVIDLEQLAVAAITAAVEEEREACAVLAFSETADPFVADEIRARANVSKSEPKIDTSLRHVDCVHLNRDMTGKCWDCGDLMEQGHVKPWNDCPTCPACNWTTGTPIGTGQLDRIDWSGSPSLRCPRCGNTWNGAPEDIVQAQRAWNAWTIESERQKREGK